MHKVILSLEHFGIKLRKNHFCISIIAHKKHEGFVGFEKSLFQSKDLRHHNVTKLRAFFMHVTVYDIIFCDGLECVNISTKAVHQQHVNCLINMWSFAGCKRR